MVRLLSLASLCLVYPAATVAAAQPDANALRVENMPVAEVKTWAGYAAVPLIDPNAGHLAFPAERKTKVLARLKAAVTAHLGEIKATEFRPRERSFINNAPPSPTIAWKFTAEKGTAEAWAELEGGLKVELTVKDDRFNCDGEKLVDEVRKVLKDFWGTTPERKPDRDSGDQNQQFIEWHGPDGKGLDARANLAAYVRRNREAVGKLAEAFVQHGDGFLRIEAPCEPVDWEALTSERYARVQGGLSEREATARAVASLDLWLSTGRSAFPGVELPKKLDDYRIRRVQRYNEWRVLLETPPAEGHSHGPNVELYVRNTDGGVGGIGSTGDHSGCNADIALNDVRAWPEYKKFHAAEKQRVADAAKAFPAVKADAVRILKAVRPELADLADKLDMVETWWPQYMVVRHQPAKYGDLPAMWMTAVPKPGGKFHVTHLRLECVRVAADPNIADRDGWGKFADRTFQPVFGREPEGKRVVEIPPPPQQQHRNVPAAGKADAARKARSGPPTPSLTVTWPVGWKYGVLPDSPAFTVQQYGGRADAIGLRWQAGPPPDYYDKARAALAAFQLRTTLAQAAMAAVRNAPVLVKDANTDGAAVTAELQTLNSTVIETGLAYAWQYEDTAALKKLASAGPVVVLWSVTITPAQPYNRIVMWIDAATGRVLRASAQRDPISCR